MISVKLIDNIHDSNFFTFETSWIGEERYDYGKNMVTIPVLNLEVSNKEVLRLLNIENIDTVYIRESYFQFTKVYKVEKRFRIHQNKKFIAKFNEELEFENIAHAEAIYELGGMGIYNGELYDGMFKVYASNCSFVVNENSPISLEYTRMSDFDPIGDNWLKNFGR